MHYWFKSYCNFAECLELDYWWSISGGGSAINGATPLGRLSHRVATSVCLSVCLDVCLFVPSRDFLGLFLALRSHDQFQASHWYSLPASPHPSATSPPPPIFFDEGGSRVQTPLNWQDNIEVPKQTANGLPGVIMFHWYDGLAGQMVW